MCVLNDFFYYDFIIKIVFFYDILHSTLAYETCMAEFIFSSSVVTHCKVLFLRNSVMTHGRDCIKSAIGCIEVLQFTRVNEACLWITGYTIVQHVLPLSGRRTRDKCNSDKTYGEYIILLSLLSTSIWWKFSYDIDPIRFIKFVNNFECLP